MSTAACLAANSSNPTRRTPCWGCGALPAITTRFDGFSIGSNDLTQLVLGIDRDSSALKALFDARDEAVKRMIARVIDTADQHGCKVGICGQAPSDYPDFAAFLVECGIDSISLNPDSVLPACRHIADAEARLAGNG